MHALPPRCALSCGWRGGGCSAGRYLKRHLRLHVDGTGLGACGAEISTARPGKKSAPAFFLLNLEPGSEQDSYHVFIIREIETG